MRAAVAVTGLRLAIRPLTRPQDLRPIEFCPVQFCLHTLERGVADRVAGAECHEAAPLDLCRGVDGCRVSVGVGTRAGRGSRHAYRMVRAVSKLRENFDKPLRIERVAKELGMSAPGFHAHFKAVTAMSPLQFQKPSGFRRPGR